jgi:hypothetical protein
MTSVNFMSVKQVSVKWVRHKCYYGRIINSIFQKKKIFFLSQILQNKKKIGKLRKIYVKYMYATALNIVILIIIFY